MISPHEKAIEHLMMAMRFAREGDTDNVQSNLRDSKVNAELHAKKLLAQGRHEDAKKYVDYHKKHMGNIERSTKIKKSELEKAIPSKTPSTIVPKPQKDPNYDYKHISQLHPTEQKKVMMAYGGRNVGEYHYATDKKTGKFAHTIRGRVPIEPSAHPTPTMGTKEVSHHTPGTTVRINSPGMAYHGKLGIVQRPSPYHPKKLMVEYGKKDILFLHPHEVTPSKPKTKVEKAMVTLNNIRKMLNLR